MLFSQLITVWLSYLPENKGKTVDCIFNAPFFLSYLFYKKMGLKCTKKERCKTAWGLSTVAVSGCGADWSPAQTKSAMSSVSGPSGADPLSWMYLFNTGLFQIYIKKKQSLYNKTVLKSNFLLAELL